MSKFGDLIKGKKVAAPAPEPVVEVTEVPFIGEDTTKYEEFIEEELKESETTDFSSMSKNELEAYGRTIGIELDKRHSKKRLIEELEEHESSD